MFHLAFVQKAGCSDEGNDAGGGGGASFCFWPDSARWYRKL